MRKASRWQDESAFATDTWNDRWRAAMIAGRVMLALIFIVSGIAKIADFDATVAHMRAEHIGAAELLLVLTVVVEILGGLALLTGLGTRWGALLLFLYLMPVTLIFHDFWAYHGLEREMQTVHFLKNLAIMGGLLVAAGSDAAARDAAPASTIPGASSEP